MMNVIASTHPGHAPPNPNNSGNVQNYPVVCGRGANYLNSCLCAYRFHDPRTNDQSSWKWTASFRAWAFVSGTPLLDHAHLHHKLAALTGASRGRRPNTDVPHIFVLSSDLNDSYESLTCNYSIYYCMIWWFSLFVYSTSSRRHKKLGKLTGNPWSQGSGTHWFTENQMFGWWNTPDS